MKLIMQDLKYHVRLRTPEAKADFERKETEAILKLESHEIRDIDLKVNSKTELVFKKRPWRELLISAFLFLAPLLAFYIFLPKGKGLL